MAEVLNDDPQLVERLRHPDTVRQAFSDVIKRYSEPLYRQIRRMVQTHADADDLLQNTFLKAWSSIEHFRGDARLSTWLYKIAVNETLSFLERERRRRGLSIDDPDTAIAAAIEADTDIDGDKLAQRLRVAISRLPEKQRLVFNMRYYDEMPYDEISAVLGTSVGALKASYHLATKKIEQFFSDEN